MTRRTRIVATIQVALIVSLSLTLLALGGNETNVGITVEPPSTGGGAIIESTLVSDLDLAASPDSPMDKAMVNLLVNVDQAVTSVSIQAEIANKSKLKIKWYNLLENGHLRLGDAGLTGMAAEKGNAWQFGTVWQSEKEWVPAGQLEVSIPVVLDLTAGGTVEPRNIPAGSTNGKASIIWIITVGTL